MADNDLSEYELERLKNIQRNNELLASLGLSSHPLAPKVRKPRSAKAVPAKRDRWEGRAPSKPTRQSKRLRQLHADAEAAKEGETEREEEDEGEEDEEEDNIDYQTIPIEPSELDDHEFQAYVRVTTKNRSLQSPVAN